MFLVLLFKLAGASCLENPAGQSASRSLANPGAIFVRKLVEFYKATRSSKATEILE